MPTRPLPASTPAGGGPRHGEQAPCRWLRVASRVVDVSTRALVVADESAPHAGGADLSADQLEDVEVVLLRQLRPEHLGPGRVVAVRLEGSDVAGDVGAATALMRHGVRIFVTAHPRPVRRATDVVGATLEAR